MARRQRVMASDMWADDGKNVHTYQKKNEAMSCNGELQLPASADGVLVDFCSLAGSCGVA